MGWDCKHISMGYIVPSVLAATLWGISNLFEKLAVDAMHQTVVFALYSGVMVVFSAGMLIWNRHDIRSRPFDRKGAVMAVTGGLTASVGTVLFLRALGRCDEAHIVSAIAYTAPVFTFVLGVMLLHDKKIVWVHVLAMLMIVGGVAIVAATGGS